MGSGSGRVVGSLAARNRECGRGSGEEWDADRGAREAPGGRGRAASLLASPGHMGPISRVPYTAACSCPWPRCASPRAPPGLHTSTEVAPAVPAERGLLTIPCQPAQPQSLQLGGGAASPPPSTPPSPGPGKWVCGSRTDAGAFPGAVGCTPCQVGDWQAPPLCRGAPRCHAHLLCLLRPTLLVLCPPSSRPCPVPQYQPARLSQTPHLTLRCLALPCASSSALPGWWHNAGCPEQGDRNSGWALTFLMLL